MSAHHLATCSPADLLGLLLRCVSGILVRCASLSMSGWLAGRSDECCSARLRMPVAALLAHESYRPPTVPGPMQEFAAPLPQRAEPVRCLFLVHACVNTALPARVLPPLPASCQARMPGLTCRAVVATGDCL